MSDMRLMVAGAGGRMGRTLIKAIAESRGSSSRARTEGEGSPLLGRDSGMLAGLPPNRVNADQRSAPRDLAADGIIDFTVPAATVELAGARRRNRNSCTSSARPACRPRTTRRSRRPRSKTVIMKSGNMSLGVNLLAALTQQVAAGARRGVRHRDRRDASQQEDRRAVRHRAAVRRGGGARAARSI